MQTSSLSSIQKVRYHKSRYQACSCCQAWQKEVTQILVQSDKHYDLGPAKKIPLNNGRFALVSPEDYEKINQHKWYAKKSLHKWYACRMTGKGIHRHIMRMHRYIAKTPADMLCHHQNLNSLDNRRKNLLNMTEFDHIKLHSWR